MRLRTYILFLSFCFLEFGMAQQGQDYLKLVRENYLHLNNMSAQLDYALYKGVNGTIPLQSYTSEYRKSGQAQYRKIDQVELLTIDSLSLNINHTDKTVTLSKHEPISYFEFDLKASLKFCKNVNVKVNESSYTVSLILKEATDIPISKIEFQIDKKYWIEQTTIFYSNQINFSDSYFETDMDFPKLVVNYHPIDKKWKDKADILKLKTYLAFKNEEPILNSSYSSYELIDGRQ